MTEAKPTLVFVYNADSGLFNTVTDIAHKLFSPSTYSCNLCAITHNAFSMQQEWREFIAALDYPLEFLHRDELADKYGVDDEPLPAVFVKTEQGLQVWLDRDAINGCEDLPALKKLINNRARQSEASSA